MYGSLNTLGSATDTNFEKMCVCYILQTGEELLAVLNKRKIKYMIDANANIDACHACRG